MPPGEKKVPAEQIAVIERWIAGGAVARSDEPATLPPGLDITAEERAYWFYQPLNADLRRTYTPCADRVRTPIDAFVLAKLREKGLTFNPEADRRHADPPGGVRPDRPAAVARGDRRISGRHVARRLREADRPACWPRPHTASGGAGTGSTWPATPTPTATATTTPSGPMPRSIAITSSARSTPTSRSTGSSIEQLAGDELVPRPGTT